MLLIEQEFKFFSPTWRSCVQLRKHDKKAEEAWGKSSRLYALVTFRFIEFVFNGLLISVS